MPKDYFEVVEEPEEVVSEAERQSKVIEFVYQVSDRGVTMVTLVHTFYI